MVSPPASKQAWPHRRQASSHRFSTVDQACAIPVGAGLPATRPVLPMKTAGFIGPRPTTAESAIPGNILGCAGCHRFSTVDQACAIPVGAGLPAMRPVLPMKTAGFIGPRPTTAESAIPGNILGCAGCHRFSTVDQACAIPVGAGLPAMRPVLPMKTAGFIGPPPATAESAVPGNTPGCADCHRQNPRGHRGCAIRSGSAAPVRPPWAGCGRTRRGRRWNG